MVKSFSQSSAGIERSVRGTKEVTIKDVATLAGVSPSTVSKVMNGSTRISEATKVRVEVAIRKLGFRPSSIARSLRKNRTLSIGMINNAPTAGSIFILPLMVGVEETARDQGFSVFLCNTNATPAREQYYLETLIDKQVDGIIFVDSKVHQRHMPAFDLGSIPLTFLYQYSPEAKAASVVPDDYQGGFMATKHLIDLGHQRVGYINGDLSFEATQLRLQGYCEALKAAGLPFDSTLVQHANTWLEEGGYRSAKELLTLKAPPTAIFCANDTLAVGALDALRDLNLDVPQDVALVGFDDRPEAEQKRPPLTTVALPFYQMGKLAVDLLLSTIRQGRVEAKVHRVACPLIVRHSCGAFLHQRNGGS